MHRLETSTAQVNAALRYLLDKGANIAGPIREINHFGLKKISLQKRPVQPRKTFADLLRETKAQILSR